MKSNIFKKVIFIILILFAGIVTVKIIIKYEPAAALIEEAEGEFYSQFTKGGIIKDNELCGVFGGMGTNSNLEICISDDNELCGCGTLGSNDNRNQFYSVEGKITCKCDNVFVLTTQYGTEIELCAYYDTDYYIENYNHVYIDVYISGELYCNLIQQADYQ